MNDYDGRLVTTRWILMEVADGFAGSPARRNVQDLFEDLETDPHVQIVVFSDALYRAGLKHYHSRPDKQWSLTDCISFVVMAEQNLSEALTGDHHFQQAGFIALFA